MPFPTGTAWTVALALAVTATPGPPRTQPQRAAPRREIALEVHNDNFHDATVYAVRSGLRQRLGWVTGFGKQTFTFRWAPGDLRVEIDLLASGRYYTQVMDVDEGDELELTILPYLHTLPPGTVF